MNPENKGKERQYKLLLNPNTVLKKGRSIHDRKIFKGLKSEKKVLPLGEQYHKIIQNANQNMKCKNIDNTTGKF